MILHNSLLAQLVERVTSTGNSEPYDEVSRSSRLEGTLFFFFRSPFFVVSRVIGPCCIHDVIVSLLTLFRC
jgi:hypothetical protein